MSTRKSTSAEEDVFFEVLTCCIHEYLYERGVYPKQVFERRSLYGVIALHLAPYLINYIDEVLNNARDWFRDEILREVYVVVKEPSTDQVVERLVFRIKSLQSGGGGAVQDGDMNDASSSSSKIQSLLSPTLLESIRTLLHSISILHGRFSKRDVPTDCTFSLLFRTGPPTSSWSENDTDAEFDVKKKQQELLGDDVPWMQIDPNAATISRKTTGAGAVVSSLNNIGIGEKSLSSRCATTTSPIRIIALDSKIRLSNRIIVSAYVETCLY